MIERTLTLFILIINSIFCNPITHIENSTCTLPSKIIKEILTYSKTVNTIIEESINGNFKGITYNEMSKFIDKFGNRLAGTKNLENSIDYMVQLSKNYGLENVHTEEVDVPYWKRGNEKAFLIRGKNISLNILGLGSSISTPPEGILAEAIVVDSFDDLEAKATKIKGKIVVFNEDFESYSATVKYRVRGASAASKFGAVAVLIRSVTGFSMNTPHTGVQRYEDSITPIPVASITVEDAEMLYRIQRRGSILKIHLIMNDGLMGTRKSRNTIAEIRGSLYPDKIIIISGHIDSWDVGKGAMDDGGGVFISWAALALLKKLNLRPKRTIRAIFWTGEEEGYIGAAAYNLTHANELNNINFIMESDIGTFTPLGIEYVAGKKGGCILKTIMKNLEKINATQAKRSNDVGSDINIWIQQGVPAASNLNANEKYFWYHHTNADTMNVENSLDLDKSTALWATVAYSIANLTFDFPRSTKINNL